MEKRVCCLRLWIIFGLLCSISGSHRLRDFLDSDSYDKMARPGRPDTPLVVTVDVYVVAFGVIEEVNMDLPVFLYVRQSWLEPRLMNRVNSTKILNREILEKIWRPDTYCSNARETDLMMPDTEVHSSVIAKPDGSVFYSRGAKIVASCSMDLRSFPFDKQQCFLKFGSYSYSENDLVYKWKNSYIEIEDSNLSQFDVTEVSTSISTSSYASGNFSHFLVHFKFVRRSGFYVMQVFIPCIIVVVISWIIFWMEIKDTGNRLTVGITAILTIMFLQSFVNSVMPKVSYAKAIDWYLILSFSFIFLALIDCVVIAFDFKSARCNTSKMAQSKRCATVVMPEFVEVEDQQQSPGGQSQNGLLKTKENVYQKDRPKLMNRISRIVFPVSFVLLNVVYWSVYIG